MSNQPKSKKEKQYYPLSIPIKPHLYQFLDFHFGNNSVFSLRSWLGVQIFSILTKKMSNGSSYAKTADDYDDHFKLQVCETYYFHFAVNNFTPFQISLFNRLIQEQFNDRMLDYVVTLEGEGVSNKDAIIRWCDRYQLDAGSTDWYQTLGRELRRKKPKFLQKLVKSVS
jgi:hypothetical protein